MWRCFRELATRTPRIQSSTVQSTRTVQDKFPPLEYLEADHITVEALGLSQETAESLGTGYAPKGMMKGYVAIPIGLPTGELTGYIGVTEAKLPKEFHLPNVVTFPRRVRKKKPRENAGLLFNRRFGS
jgi:hypothetical protein